MILLHGNIHPPPNAMGVEDLWAAWVACTVGCIPLVLRDLNIDFGEPRNKWEELIVDHLDDINLVDTSRQFTPIGQVLGRENVPPRVRVRRGS